jgi:hypothetical protein
MTNVDALHAAQRPCGGKDPEGALLQLGALLDLPSVGLAVRGARVVGRGSSASADIYLSDDTMVTFETLRDVANASRLSVEMAACTGATPRLKAPQAVQAVALIRAIAEHHATFTADEIAVDWGADYLQAAEILDVEMTDQHTRWRAFSRLAAVQPAVRAAATGCRLSAATVVLRHTDGTRYVRCGWFREAVRAQDANISPQQLAQRMERIGWSRRGGHGRIKASRPGGSGQLGWNFYVVSAEWEEGS